MGAGTMKQVAYLILSITVCLPLVGHAQEQNQWHNMGGWLSVTRGWLDWKKNDYDGGYCLFSGHSSQWAYNDVRCYYPSQNAWEIVYPGDYSATPPRGGDLHSWSWDPVDQEYLLFDSAKTGPRAYAFHMPSRTWTKITNSDFAGIEDRTFISAAGTATDPDHNLIVIVGGSYWGTPIKVVRYIDLNTHTYSEQWNNVPPARTAIQNQFLYINSLHKFLLFSGLYAGNDVWLLDPTNRQWTPVATVNPPPATANAQMAYDSEQNIVYLAGGTGGSARVWILHLSDWTWEELPLPDGSPLVDYPSRRVHGTAMYDPSTGFCTTAGVLDGASYWYSLRTWCFRHTVVLDTMAPTIPGGGATTFVPSYLGNLTVSWGASPDDPNDVDHYDVQRSEDGGNTWKGLTTVPATGATTYDYTYMNVPSGPARVRAVDTAGNGSQYIIVY